MTVRQVAWFLGAYAALVALAIWFNLAVLALAEVGFLFIDKFPVLLATEAVAIIIAGVARGKTVLRQSPARSPVA